MLLFPDSDAKAKRASASREGEAVPLRRGDRREQALGSPARPRRQGHEEGRTSSGRSHPARCSATCRAPRPSPSAASSGASSPTAGCGGSTIRAPSRAWKNIWRSTCRAWSMPLSLTDLLTERDEAMREHWLRVFALMFGRTSFVEQTRRRPHLPPSRPRRGPQLGRAGRAGPLQSRVPRPLPRSRARAGRGRPHRPAPRTDAYLRELKEAALTLLYRLLFVLYAEDRDLLPVRDERYDNYGLSPIRNEIAERIDGNDTLRRHDRPLLRPPARPVPRDRQGRALARPAALQWRPVRSRSGAASGAGRFAGRRPGARSSTRCRATAAGGGSTIAISRCSSSARSTSACWSTRWWRRTARSRSSPTRPPARVPAPSTRMRSWSSSSWSGPSGRS